MAHFMNEVRIGRMTGKVGNPPTAFLASVCFGVFFLILISMCCTVGRGSWSLELMANDERILRVERDAWSRVLGWLCVLDGLVSWLD